MEHDTMQRYIGDKPVSEDEYWETLIARGDVTSRPEKPNPRDEDLERCSVFEARSLARQARDERDATLAENLRLREVLQAVVDVDPDPCRLDHHGNCQAHYLGNPCHIAEAKRLLREGASHE